MPRNKVPPPAAAAAAAAAAATASFQRNAQILPCVGRPFRSLRLHLLALKGKHAYRTASDCLRCGTSQWKLPCSNYVGMGHRTSSAEFEELLAANTTHAATALVQDDCRDDRCAAGAQARTRRRFGRRGSAHFAEATPPKYAMVREKGYQGLPTTKSSLGVLLQDTLDYPHVKPFVSTWDTLDCQHASMVRVLSCRRHTVMAS